MHVFLLVSNLCKPDLLHHHHCEILMLCCAVVLRSLQSFWSRLAGKYGNKFFWQEKGEAAAILNAVSSMRPLGTIASITNT